MKRDIQSQNIKITDASSQAVGIIAPQLGSNQNTLALGIVDNDRLTFINEAEVLWLSWFQNIPEGEGGEFASNFCNRYKDLRMSTNGHRANLLVKALGNITGHSNNRPVKDKRNWVQRNVLDRDGGPEDED